MSEAQKTSPRQRIIEAATKVPYLESALINDTCLAAAAEALRLAIEMLEQQANDGYFGEDVEGDYLAAQRVRDLLSSLLGPQGEEKKEDDGASAPMAATARSASRTPDAPVSDREDNDEDGSIW